MKSIILTTNNQINQRSDPLMARSSGMKFISSVHDMSPLFFGPATIQPKLEIGPSDDKYEKEADRVADELMRMPEPTEAKIQRKCKECEEEEKKLRHKEGNGEFSPRSLSLVNEVLNSSFGKPLGPDIRAFMEARFGYDFNSVRIHDDARSSKSANTINASAYTSENNIVFSEGKYSPDTDSGKKLLAHELTHVVQQKRANQTNGTSPEQAPVEVNLSAPRRLAKQEGSHRIPGPVSIRSPFLEETLTQISTIGGELSGRPLTSGELALLMPIFQHSLDYSRIRLIETDILDYRTVGNVIRVPRRFTIANPEMAQTLVHEATHVWQYQHGGTRYLSDSIQTQIVAGVTRGNRNFAYAYLLRPDSSFFDFTPEQQANIVENYFAMLRDRNTIQAGGPQSTSRSYNSNHFDAQGFPRQLTATQRLAEISAELPLHEHVIAQLRAALPRPEHDLLMQRARDVMTVPGAALAPLPEGSQIVPTRPIVEVRFPGL